MKQKGASIFEVVIAIAIAAIVMTAIVSLSSDSLSNSLYSKNKTLANRYASEALEWIRWQRVSYDDFEAFSLQATASAALPSDTDYWCLTDLSFTNNYECNLTLPADSIDGENVYFRTMYVTPGVDRLEVTIKVVWREPDGYHESESSTTLVDY